MITSAVVLVVALLAVLAVLVVKARRGTRLATAGYVEPVPSAPTPLDEGDQWRRQLLEAIEAAASDLHESAPPGALHGQENPRPVTGSPVPGAGTDPQETAAWTPPFEPPGPLESLFNSEPSKSLANPLETSPFDPFAPDSDPEYRGRRRRSEPPATDESADDDTRPDDPDRSTP
ncbi:hypothetical protein [Nonomuraea insulae]|uniref:Secreted protein n=1 Tax=Nonomuraea insulae TaxID=1616787 RepID=A0ABW1CIW5_9ACTN